MEENMIPMVTPKKISEKINSVRRLVQKQNLFILMLCHTIKEWRGNVFKMSIAT